MGAGSNALFQASDRVNFPFVPFIRLYPKASYVRLNFLAVFIKMAVSLSFTSATELHEKGNQICFGDCILDGNL